MSEYQLSYKRPPGVRYVDMAIYFDEHFADEDRDDELLFQYLYHLFYMLAGKKKYFRLFEEYDLFAVYAATTIYLRAMRKLAKGDRITSILNYCKASLYPLKVNFQKEQYEEVINPGIDSRIDENKLREGFHVSIQSDYLEGLRDDIKYQLTQLPFYVNEVIDDTPYKNDKLMRKRLYLSITLSFLNSITLSNASLRKLNQRRSRSADIDALFQSLMKEERDLEALVWRLDASMVPYIAVLTNKVRDKFGQYIIELKNAYMLSEDELEDIMLSAYDPPNFDGFTEE